MKKKAHKSFSLKFKLTPKYLTISLVYNPQILLAIISGLIFALAFIFLPQFLPSLSNPRTEDSVSIEQTANPHTIEIPSISLTMNIKPAVALANDWQVYDDAVSWLSTSGNLNSGNIVLYAHNKKDAFGKIIQMGIGNEIILKSDQIEQKYQVTQIFDATPKDIHLLENTNENKLTMYTCSGWFDAKRFFVIALPVE